MSIQPGGIKIENIHLLGAEGFVFLDLKEIMVEFNIYEALDKPYMKMELLLSDALSLVTTIPIVGSELIKVKFFVPVEGMEDRPFERIFRVMAIEKINIDRKVRNATYILKCYDPEYFTNASTQFSEAFDDNAHKIVETIWTKYLKGDAAKLKTTDCNKVPIVIPYSNPFTAIKIVSELSESSEFPDYSSHVFFASKAGFNYTSIPALCDKTKKPEDYVIEKYTLKEKSVFKTSNEVKATENSKSKKPDEWRKISNFDIVNRMDIDSMIQDGSIGNTTWYINPNVKLYGKTEFSYIKQFDKIPKISTSQGHQIISNEKKEMEFSATNYFLVTKYGENIDTNAYDKRYKFLGAGLAAKRLMNSITVNITLPGDNTLVVGDLIDLQFPEFGATDDILGKTDRFISGNYLITAVRHLYNTVSGYATILRCNKNAFEENISDTINKNADGKKGTQATPTVEDNKPEVTSADI